MSAGSTTLRGRRAAESTMRDTCRVTIPGDGEPGWDEETGTATPPPPVVLYEGKCKVQRRNVDPQDATPGQLDAMIERLRIDLPMVSADYAQKGGRQVHIPIDAKVEITGLWALSDPDLLGMTCYVQGFGSQKTYATARRMECEEVSDAR